MASFRIATSVRFVILFSFATTAAACHRDAPGTGDDDDDQPGPDGGDVVDAPGTVTTPPVWDELTDLMVNVDGGTALAAGGRGTAGGTVRLGARGSVVLDPGVALAPMPAVTAPAGGAAITAVELAGDVTRSGSMQIAGLVVASGDAPVRTITSTAGDIVVVGMLRGADHGTVGQSLVLRAPAGTVYVMGTLSAGGDDGDPDGDAAGSITIDARSVVIAGRVLAAGEGSASGAGGRGGDVTLTASAGPIVMSSGAVQTAGGRGTTRGGDAGALAVHGGGTVWLTGAIDSFGGDAVGDGEVVGGAGGALTIAAVGDLDLSSTTRLRGGAASTMSTTATGGGATTMMLDSAGSIRIAAIIDGRGGLARAGVAGGAVTAGAPASLVVGDALQPVAVALRQPIAASGGDGFATGGEGGMVELHADSGGLGLAENITVDGGDAQSRPGKAGQVHGEAGPHGGGIGLVGQIYGIGGSGMGTDSNDGGTGAVVVFEVTSFDGDMVVAASGGIFADGGTATGSGTAGGGGDLSLISRSGSSTMAGQLIARGGRAAGGTGGYGGILDIFSDRDFNGIGGNLLIDTTGLIDVSGGSGTIGGNARNDGANTVANFPDQQYLISVLLNSDGMHGDPQNGELVNLGHIIARGGAPNGAGGDSEFHGRRPGSDFDPEPGDMDLMGEGSGAPGDFIAE